MIWCLTSQSSITTFFNSLCNHIITFSIGFANHNTTHTFISIPYICTCNMAVLERLDMPWPETEHDHETLKHYRGIWYWQYRYNFHEQFTCFTFFKHPSNSCGFDPQLTCIHLEAVGLQLRGELNFIIPTDELHHFFFRGVGQPPTRWFLSLPCPCLVLSMVFHHVQCSMMSHDCPQFQRSCYQKVSYIV